MDRRSDADIFLFDEDAKDFDRSGAASPSADQDATTVAGPSDVKSMDLFRRAMPQMVAEEDVCSICLDAFTDEDPGNATVCGHDFHLQCIMQWAQRSRECPLCFRELALQDPAMQELLPFGEYVAPDTGGLSAAFMGFESWDMDALLQRLALQGGTQTRRHRPRSRARPLSLHEPPRGGEDAEVPASGARGSAENQEALVNGDREADAFPSSWPPRGVTLNISQAGQSDTAAQGMHREPSADIKSAAESLKSRWSSFRSSFQSRCRESLGRSTSGFKSKPDKPESTSQAHPPH